MDFQTFIKLLLDAGFTPLNVVLLAAIVVLYRDNRDLWTRLQKAEDNILKKVNLPDTAPPPQK